MATEEDCQTLRLMMEEMKDQMERNFESFQSLQREVKGMKRCFAPGVGATRNAVTPKVGVTGAEAPAAAWIDQLGETNDP